MGSFGDEDKTGKANDGDIKEGKKTMLLIEALRLSTSKQKSILDKYLGKSDLTPAEVDKVRDVFPESGAVESAGKMMTKLLDEGQEALNKADPPLNEEYKQFMLDLSNFLVSRDY